MPRETITEYYEKLQLEVIDVPPENFVNYDETNITKKVNIMRECKYTGTYNKKQQVLVACLYCIQGGPIYTRYNRTKSG